MEVSMGLPEVILLLLAGGLVTVLGGVTVIVIVLLTRKAGTCPNCGKRLKKVCPDCNNS